MNSFQPFTLFPIVLTSALAITLHGGCQDAGVIKHNVAPEAFILSHVNGEALLEGHEVVFIGNVSDLDGQAEGLQATWYAGQHVICDPSPPASNGRTSCARVITSDDNPIRLEVSDPEGAMSSAKIQVHILETAPPTAQITSPALGGMYYKYPALIPFSGVVTDAEDDNASLLARWESDIDGVLSDIHTTPNADGAVEGFGGLSEGLHTLRLHVTDSTGKTASDHVLVYVNSDNQPPRCELSSPSSGTTSASGESIHFMGWASDVDIPADWLTVEWSSDKDGLFGTSTPNTDTSLSFHYAGLSIDTHVISMTARDEAGARCTTSIVHHVGTPPTLLITEPKSGDTLSDRSLVHFIADIYDLHDAPEEIDLVWSSDVDGPLDTSPPNSDGIAEFMADGLSVGTHRVRLTATDPGGLQAHTLVVFQVNASPTAPGISLSPIPAVTTDDLRVFIASPSTDLEGDPITYRYTWTQDGVLSSASTGPNLSHSATKKGEIWQVRVTPNDGHGDGAFAIASAEIGNTPPTQPILSIAPSKPKASTDDLVCRVDTPSADADGDPIHYTMSWTVDGATFTGTTTTRFSGDTITAANTAGGEVWACTATPNDGEDDGSPAKTSVTVQHCAGISCGVKLTGESTGDQAGVGISSAGDVNGDGFADILLGAFGEDAGGTSAGATYLVLGASGTISDMSLSSSDAKWTGESAEDYSGLSVTGAGDINGDGYSDVVIGAYGEDTGGSQAGAAYLVLGSSSGLTDMSLSAADAKWTGEKAYDFAGFSLSTVGDMNGDGYADVLIGADGEDIGGTDAGAAYLILGASSVTDMSLSSADAKWTGETANDSAGWSLSDAGDVDGDGYSDALIGALGDDTAATSAGAAYLVLGTSSLSDMSLSDADAKWTGERAYDFACYTRGLATAGDVDGDGYSDVLVGVPGEDTGGQEAGAAYLILGTSSVSDMSLSSADAKWTGESAYDYAGFSVSTAGDVDGDGFADMLVGAYGEDTGGTSAGAAYLIWGASSGLADMSLSGSDLKWSGESAYDALGLSLSRAGDVNGDGHTDLLIGTRDANTGFAYLLYGNTL